MADAPPKTDEADAPALTQPAAPAPEAATGGDPVAVTAPLADCSRAVDDTAGKRAAAQAGLPESAAAPAAPAAKQAKRDPAVPAEEKKPKDVIEVEAPRANAA